MVRIYYINLCFDWWYLHSSRIVEWIFECYFQIEKNLNLQLNRDGRKIVWLIHMLGQKSRIILRKVV